MYYWLIQNYLFNVFDPSSNSLYKMKIKIQLTIRLISQFYRMDQLSVNNIDNDSMWVTDDDEDFEEVQELSFI